MKPVALRLLLLGLIGVASLLLLPIEQISRAPFSAPALRLLATVQPALLVLGFTLLGAWLAPKVGLDAPATRAWAEGRPALPILRGQLALATIGGLIGAAVLLIYGAASQEVLASRAPPIEVPLVAKLLYGGLTEELISRWGLMTFFVWLLWRVGRRPDPVPGWCYWGGATFAALLFAAGHLPILFLMMESPPGWLVAAVLGGNFLPGLVFGWLFWKRGLEAAMIGHALAHLFATGAGAVLPGD